MKLRKNTLIFALMLILICFFAACDEAAEGEITEKTPTLEEVSPSARLKVSASGGGLSTEKACEIIWEYIAGGDESELDATYSVKCYGAFGDAYAVMINGPWMYTQALRDEIIAGYTFTFPNGQRMHIYKDGVFYSLLKAYELGVISEENLVAINWSKTAPYTYTTDLSPVELNERELYSLVEDNLKGNSHAKDTEYSIRCYGKVYMGCAAFIDRNDVTYKQNETRETVAGFEFIYPTEQTMAFYLWYEKPVSMSEAYAQEYVSSDELKEIYDTYRAAHPELYE